MRAEAARHVCYEDSPDWHGTISKKVSRCDYRLCPLERTVIDGVACNAYSGVAPVEFDLALVDGPRGADHYSRFGCIDTIRRNQRTDFVIVFDDCDRPGERQTIRVAKQILGSKGIGFEERELSGRTRQAVFAAGALKRVLYYW